jgi:adenosylcobinamide kinase/adenosylcobinamide-phosphate guanylyltransferase
MTARLILILGGARSGKSTFAERLAASTGRSVAYIATATADDEEMRARILRHQTARPADWLTLEEPLDLAGAARRAAAQADVLLLDCLTLWSSNWLLQHWDERAGTSTLEAGDALQHIAAFLGVLRELPDEKIMLVVSNEVGLGLVPEYPLGRVYRDILGYVNQRLAREAERVYFLVAGIAVDVKRLGEEPSL